MKNSLVSPVLFFVLTCIAIKSFSQAKTYLAQVELNKKHGCIDLQGKEIIPVKYDDMGFWGNGLIPVNTGAKEVNYLKKGGKWGYCNAKGVLVIPMQFEAAETFCEGKAPVRIKNKWGFIDTTGKMIIAPQYDQTSQFRNELCVVAKNRKWGIIDATGKEVIKLEYGELNDFENGVARAFVGTKSDDGWEVKGGYCLINRKGEQITAPKYKSIFPFSDGLARVEVPSTENKYDTKSGFINEMGELVIPAIYDEAEDFTDGMAAVGFRKKQEGIAFLESEYTWGYVNKQGVEVVKPQYSQASKFMNDRAIVGKGNQRGFIVVIEAVNDSIINHESHPKAALIDKDGRYLLNFDWQWLNPISDSLFIAHRAKYKGAGVINSKGETIIPFKYANLHYAGDSLFTANDGRGKGGESMVVDIHNNVLFRTKKYFIPELGYEFGLLHIRNYSTNKEGLIDARGNMVIKDKYDMIVAFEATE